MDDLSNIDNNYFDSLVSKIYPLELQLNKANSFETDALFLDLHLSILNVFLSCKVNYKRDGFDFEIDNGKLTTRLYDKRDFPIVNFPFLSSNIPSAPAYGVYVSLLIR